ncbi:MAG: nucleotidyltransferase family protein [Aphanothece sp. CMT-3BRIN-NPC111]|jgi:hypothetical protein|nr:nucleotidyltransferase family protein [Aphanothece sp. CMT-3BRIN-NPC111]
MELIQNPKSKIKNRTAESSITISPKKQRPEIELLLCCARTQMQPEYAERICQLVQQDLDWHCLLEAASWHGVMPLLHLQLKDICPQAVPQPVLDDLRNAFNANARKNLLLSGELLKLLKIFKDHGIPSIPFKGSVLAAVAYKNIGMREFADLDILVPEQFVPQARKLLIAQGYQPQFNLTDAQELIYINLRNEHMFWHQDKQIPVDLHWSMMPKNFSFSRKLEFSEKWYEQVYLGGNLVQTLSAESLLLFLCAHGSKDSWLRLKLICDLAELIRSHKELDWDWILANGGKLGTKRMLFLGLYLSQDILGVVLPENIFQQVQSDPLIKALASQVKQQLFSQTKQENKLLKRKTIYLKTMESLQDKIWFYFDNVMTPTPLEWAIVPLPMRVFPLYYPIRLMRLIIKHSMRRLS